MIISSKKPKILASQINAGGKPVVLPPPTPQVFTMGGAANNTPGQTATTTTTNTPVTSTPLSGSSGSSGSLSSGTTVVSKSISSEAEKDIEYYIKKYWYIPAALIALYIANKKYRWF